MPRFVTNTKWYGWRAPEGELRQTRLRLLFLVGINLIISIACGLIPTGVTRNNWVSFAATAALLAMAAEVIGAVRFYRAGEQMYQREFEAIDHFIRLPCIMHIMLTLVALVAAIVSCIRNWTGWLDALVLILLASTGACSFLVYRLYRALPAFIIDNPA